MVLLEFVEVAKSYSQGEEGGCVLEWTMPDLCSAVTHTHTHTVGQLYSPDTFEASSVVMVTGCPGSCSL